MWLHFALSRSNCWAVMLQQCTLSNWDISKWKKRIMTESLSMSCRFFCGGYRWGWDAAAPYYWSESGGTCLSQRCVFLFYEQTWRENNQMRQKSMTISIVESGCSNNRGYVKGICKLRACFFLELTLRTQQLNTWPEKHLIPRDFLSLQLCVTALHPLLSQQS